jgi:ribosomal protein S18 acetylase RimI-like enzyme
MTPAVNEGHSVICIDTTTDDVVGAFIVRDFAFFPDGFKDKYKSEGGAKLSNWTQLLLSMESRAEAGCKELTNLAPGVAADLFFLGVLPEHRGKGIATDLVRLCVENVRATGFQVATLPATSHFTADAAELNGFKQVVSLDVAKEEASFVDVPNPHGTWKMFMKDLTKEDVEAKEKLCAE